MKKTIVVALGGNALGNTPEEQLVLAKKTAKTIVDLVKDGNSVIVTHGNGPQVGMINLAMEYSSEHGGQTAKMPFAECGAMSQGYIGYHLQQSIKEELRERNIDKSVSTVITQVLVDSSDEAFKNPTKPIGSFYTKEASEKISKETGYTFIEDAGRGYRRVVPSPSPINIIEINTIKELVNSGEIVITIGGGGIPVIDKKGDLIGVDAVIDKDRSSACLANLLDADVLLILTAVPNVSINFNKPNQEVLKELTVEQAKKYIKEGQFAKGSMLPKIEACISFLEKNTNSEAIIASLEQASEAVKKESGTIITNNKTKEDNTIKLLAVFKEKSNEDKYVFYEYKKEYFISLLNKNDLIKVKSKVVINKIDILNTSINIVKKIVEDTEINKNLIETVLKSIYFVILDEKLSIKEENIKGFNKINI